jgi:hydrogenase-4 component F
MLYSSMSLLITFLGFMCLTQSASCAGWRSTSWSTSWAASAHPRPDAWQRLGLSFMLFGLGSKLGLAPHVRLAARNL